MPYVTGPEKAQAPTAAAAAVRLVTLQLATESGLPDGPAGASPLQGRPSRPAVDQIS